MSSSCCSSLPRIPDDRQSNLPFSHPKRRMWKLSHHSWNSQCAVGMIAPDLSDVHLAAAKNTFRKANHTQARQQPPRNIFTNRFIDPNLFIAPKLSHWRMCPKHYASHFERHVDQQTRSTAIVKYLNGLPAGAYGDCIRGKPHPPHAQAPTTGADVVRDPTDLPAPLEIREPTTVRIDLEAVEVEGQLADGTTFTYWTFNGAVPGPFFRVRVGDTIEVHMKNNTSSTMNHSVDFHAVTGPGGGAVMTQTATRQRKHLHRQSAQSPDSSSIIAPRQWLPITSPTACMDLSSLSRKAACLQLTANSTSCKATSTPQAHLANKASKRLMSTKLLNEDPEYIVFNGAVGALTAQKPLKANVGETVRIFFGVGGPNFTSSFHVIGEIFDRVYDQASLTSSTTHRCADHSRPARRRNHG